MLVWSDPANRLNNIPGAENYDGSGEDRFLFYRALDV